MESVGMMRTIMGMVQDILSAAETASRNKSCCDKIAERVRCIRDILEAAAQFQDGTPTPTAAAADDDATRRLLDRLEEALGRALQVVRRCQRISFFRSVIVVGGRMADPLDGVEAEIDRCVLDLTLAYSLRIARLETLLLRRQHQHTITVAAAEDSSTEDKRKKKVESGVPEKTMKMHHGKNTTASEEEGFAAIGVPVCAVHELKHEMTMVPPPSYSYGHGYGCRSCYCYHGCACDCGCWDDDNAAGRPSDAVLYRSTQYSTYPSMFSDDNPNSCSIM